MGETLLIEQLQLLFTVALAGLLGGVIGLERELADKPAGLRTHMFVAAAAALLVSIGDVLLRHFEGNSGNDLLRADPIRLVEAVITGVAFLGAGTIIRPRGDNEVEGLTTAASLLFTAAVGICVTLSLYTVAIGAVAGAVVILRGVYPLERWLAAKRTGSGSKGSGSKGSGSQDDDQSP